VSVANIADNSVLDSSTFNNMAATASYKLYDCEKGHCRQTQGYALSGNIMYAFVDRAVGVKTDSKEEFVGSTPIVLDSSTNNDEALTAMTCDSFYNGKLYNFNSGGNNGVLINCGTSTKVGIQFAKEEDYHLILKGSVASGSPFADTFNNIVIKRDLTYVARNQFYSSGNY